jgi:hypothetical protein
MASDAYVPVDRRWLGLDSRTIAPSLVVLVLTAVFALVLPRINDAVDSTREITAGTVVDLAEGRLVFTPTPGWNLAAGVERQLGRSVVDVGSTSEVTSQDLVFAVVTGPFDGTPPQLLDQINSTDSKLRRINRDLRNRTNLGPPTRRANIQTTAGVLGVADFYTGLQQQGLNAAFTFRLGQQRVGVEVIVRGSDDTLTKNVGAVTSMLQSIRTTGAMS